MQVTIQEVTVETVKKGNNKPYYKALVTHEANGKSGVKQIMSFANPSVFDAVKNASSGSEWDVEIKKEGDFWNWISMTALDGDSTAPTKTSGGSAVKPTGGKVLGSTYETPDERKIKQMYIIKQSSISNAIEYLKATREGGFDAEDITSTAQVFVDFVYDNNADILKQDNDLADVPY